MRIELHVSGGFAGLRLGGAIETSELDPELARRVEDCLEPAKLAELAAKDRDAVVVDAQQFEIRLVPPSGSPHSFELAEQGLDDETLDVLDALRLEITRREMARHKDAARRGDPRRGKGARRNP